MNCICPGFIQTDIFLKRVRKKDPNRFKKILSRTPLDRFGKVEDISNVVGFLCSADAKFITGTTLPVDGGFHSSFLDLMIKRYKTALITGAANGIGYSILKKLSDYKFKIYALDKDKESLNQFVIKLEPYL